ncbi:MAG: hypothetical protein JW889_14985 [Verrucomicrobia bacterium]|nr:hypothetical protein [Verrucomicrobiota bacterium]
MQVRRRRQQFGAAARPEIAGVAPSALLYPNFACTVTGRRFGATQGSSALELTNNANYAQATIRRGFTVDGWSDPVIEARTPSLSGLPQTCYVFVVTNSGVSNAYPVTVVPV